MQRSRVLIVTGLPASGKSVLAARLARHYAWPLLDKDTMKETLFEVLRARDTVGSRSLSDASFALLFAIATRLLATQTALLLEGNFRVGEHERELLGLTKPAPRFAQILCRIGEPERRARLAARAADPTRHRAHPDAHAESSSDPHPPRGNDAFLVLPGVQLIYEARDADPARISALTAELDRAFGADARDP